MLHNVNNNEEKKKEIFHRNDSPLAIIKLNKRFQFQASLKIFNAVDSRKNSVVRCTQNNNYIEAAMRVKQEKAGNKLLCRLVVNVYVFRYLES